MKVDQANTTLQCLVNQYQKRKCPLNDKKHQMHTSGKGLFSISKCYLCQAKKFGFWGFSSQSLFFVNKDTAKNRIFVGYIKLNEVISGGQPAINLQHFIENDLIVRSEYVESQIMLDLDREVKSPQMLIKFRGQMKSWKLFFQTEAVVQAWHSQLENIIGMAKQSKPQTIPTSIIGSSTSMIEPSRPKEFHKQKVQISQSQALKNPAQANSSKAKKVQGMQKQIQKTQSVVSQIQSDTSLISKCFWGKMKYNQSIQTIEKQQIQILTQANSELNNKQSQLRRQIADLEKKCSQLKAAYSTQQNQLQKSVAKVRQLQRQNSQLAHKLAQREITIESMKQSQSQKAESFTKSISEIKNQLAAKTQQCQTLAMQLNRSQLSASQLQTDKKLIQRNLTQSNEEVGVLRQKLKEAQQKITKLNIIDAQNSLTILVLNEEAATVKDKLSQKQSQFDRLLNHAQTLQHEHSQQQSQISALQRKLQAAAADSYLHIFEGEVLHTCLSQKQFLRQSLETYSKRAIEYTRLLYRFDTVNKANFHKYFDNHPHLCIVLRLNNGMLIAGYSEDPVNPDKQAAKGGIICSLTTMNSFELLKGYRSVTYDDYFLIYGNSELRIRWGELMLFSNFAISNGYYDARGENYTVLMGEGATRTQRIDHYEIFEVVFR